MAKSPIYVTFSGFKGGTGASIFTVILAGRLNYIHKIKSAIVDCDDIQYFCYSLREREKKMQNDISKSYPILKSCQKDALYTAEQIKEEDLQIVFFDMPKNSFSLISKMDIVYLPVVDKQLSYEDLRYYMEFAGTNPEVRFRTFLNRKHSHTDSSLFGIMHSNGISNPTNVIDIEIEVMEKQLLSAGLISTAERKLISTLYPTDQYLINQSGLYFLETDLLTQFNLLKR